MQMPAGRRSRVRPSRTKSTWTTKSRIESFTRERRIRADLPNIPDTAETSRFSRIIPRISPWFPLKKQEAQRPKDRISLVIGLSRWRKEVPGT
jgi:hypothetical protein